MTEQMEEFIKEVAVKHGIALGRDDPILILQTMNARLIEKNIQAHQILLHQFKEEAEFLAHRWNETAKTNAERILNASLLASKEAMSSSFASAEISAEAIRNNLEELLSSCKITLLQTKRIAIFNIAASVLTLVAVFCAFFIH